MIYYFNNIDIFFNIAVSWNTNINIFFLRFRIKTPHTRPSKTFRGVPFCYHDFIQIQNVHHKEHEAY